MAESNKTTGTPKLTRLMDHVYVTHAALMGKGTVSSTGKSTLVINSGGRKMVEIDGQRFWYTLVVGRMDKKD